ncbi:putative membrane domain protein, partial [Escherichia coli NE098]
SPARCLRLSPP